MEKLPPLRADGAQSRERLLLAAMRLFAEQGYARTSTREIALAAGANIASISYYFGDKAGLYRAAFTELQHKKLCLPDPQASLRSNLATFYSSLLEPLKQGELARLCMRLWFREMLEPTGLWVAQIDNGIKPAHAGLVQLLSGHLGVAEPGDDMARLAFSVVGLAIQMMVTRDVIDSIRPQLLATPEAIDAWQERLVDFAEAMIESERVRLAAAKHKKSPARKKKP
ncbi:MAG: CerR family C-terminal domain-containing protein [Pseudomonadota bacterium]